MGAPTVMPQQCLYEGNMLLEVLSDNLHLSGVGRQSRKTYLKLKQTQRGGLSRMYHLTLGRRAKRSLNQH